MFNNKILSIILMVALLLLIIPPVSGVAQLSWSKTIGYCITAVDTNDLGTIIYAGLGNGSIFAYDNTGNLTWVNSTNSTATLKGIKKLISDTDGNLVWINQANQTGYISYTGAVAGVVSGTGRNITDVNIKSDGTRFATTELDPPRIVIRFQNGTSEVRNTSFGDTTTTPTRWTKIGYDANGDWVVTANASSGVLYFWNFSTYTGWDEFNLIHTIVKSPNQTFLDQFPYRQNISIDGTVLGKELIFINTTNTTYIQRLNNSHYEYNAINTGRYFYWTRSGYENESQSSLLYLSWINASTSIYHVALKPGYVNYTIYYGLTSYNNTVSNASSYFISGIYNLSGSSGDIGIPLNAITMKYFVVGGGGGGGTAGAGAGSNGTNISGTLSILSGRNFTYIIGAGGAAGVNGTNSSLSNTSLNLSAMYGKTNMMAWSATGQNGTGTAQFSPPVTSLRGAQGGSCNGWDGDACQSLDIRTGTWGGYGYGAGGGQGGYQNPGGCICGCPAGGAGIAGVVNVTFTAFAAPSYNTSVLGSQQARATAIGMNQSSSKTYVGNILGLSVPQSGGLVSIITDTIFYQQYMSAYGFGITYCATLSSGGPALFAGTPYALSASNSGAASIEGRGAYGNIYDAGGVAKASSLTGGTIRAVDSSMSTGIFAAFGGDDGKIYMLSREGSSSWYSFYTGAADTRIDAVAVAWDGSSVSVGRFGGTLEYYLTNVTIPVTPTTTFVDTSVYVFKDGAAYASQPVTIYSSATAPSSWVPVATVYTDGAGKVTYTTTSGTYYKFVVNNVPGTEAGEGEKIWQSSSAATTVYIYVLTPSTPYEWNAYYTDSTSNVTVIYSDSVTPSSVTVTIKDLKTNLNVMTRTYSSTPSFVLEYHDTTGMGSYQVNIVINRLNMISRDQRMVSSSNTYGITFPVDIYIVYAISTLFLMLLAGMFSYANSKRGALAVVVVAVVLMVFKMLPWSMITVAMLAAIFAVMSLFASRVQ